jgi:hypothetical protein
MSIQLQQGIVHNAGVSGKWSVPDFSDPKFSGIAQTVGSYSRGTTVTTKTDSGVEKTTANTTKEGIIGAYDPKFNVVN